MLKKALLTLALLAMSGVICFAVVKDEVVTSSDGRMTFVPKRPVPGQAQSSTRSAASSAALVTVFNNIGKAYPKGSYSCCDGYIVAGPDSPSGPEAWVAAAFTPRANHVVTEVEVALSVQGGTNELVLSLNNDAGGQPGTAIKIWDLQSLPAAGTCCTIEVKKDGAGVPITAGTRYWIVVSTKKNSDIQAVWNVNDTNQMSPRKIAFYCSSQVGECQNNDAWTVEKRSPGPAFAVLGSE
jgi:hypothetical protein